MGWKQQKREGEVPVTRPYSGEGSVTQISSQWQILWRQGTQSESWQPPGVGQLFWRLKFVYIRTMSQFNHREQFAYFRKTKLLYDVDRKRSCLLWGSYGTLPVILSSAIPILYLYCFIFYPENALLKHILAISIFITLHDEMWLKCKCGNAYWFLRRYVIQFGRNLPLCWGTYISLLQGGMELDMQCLIYFVTVNLLGKM